MADVLDDSRKMPCDMHDLDNHYYPSESQGTLIKLAEMDIVHLVRAFKKGVEKTVNQVTDEDLIVQNRDLVSANKTLSNLHDTWKEKAMNMVEKSSYQVMWDNCEKLKEDVKMTDNIVERNDRIYKKNLAELQDKYDDLKKKSEYDGLNVEGVRTVWQDRYEHELKNAEYWKAQYRIANDMLQPKGCGYTFSEIPNDTDGQEFVDNMKKYFNKKSYKMRVRGQHVKPELRGTGVTSHGQNIDESTHLRIYIDIK